jgi:hypothetical protein
MRISCFQKFLQVLIFHWRYIKMSFEFYYFLNIIIIYNNIIFIIKYSDRFWNHDLKWEQSYKFPDFCVAIVEAIFSQDYPFKH